MRCCRGWRGRDTGKAESTWRNAARTLAARTSPWSTVCKGRVASVPGLQETELSSEPEWAWEWVHPQENRHGPPHNLIPALEDCKQRTQRGHTAPLDFWPTEAWDNKRIVFFVYVCLCNLLLKSSRFTMLCQTLLYSKMIQLYTYIHSFFIVFSIMVYHRILNTVPELCIKTLLFIIILWIYQTRTPCVFLSLPAHFSLATTSLFSMSVSLSSLVDMFISSIF